MKSIKKFNLKNYSNVFKSTYSSKLFLTVISSILLLFSSCKKQKEPSAPRYPVVTTKVIKKDQDIYLKTIGHIEALKKIDIRSRVEGEIKKVNFKQGSYVCKNDLLFVIDPKNYLASLDKTKAELKQNLANFNFAKDTLKRNKIVFQKEYISQIDFDNMITNVQVYDAIVKQNEADVKNAEINLDYCYIKSPVNGQIGILNIDQGNLVSANEETPIATIVQTKPIYTTFLVSQKDFYQIKKYNRICPLDIKISYDDFKTELIGSLSIIDNEIDETTANIKLRATFSNDDNMLTSGEYVSCRVVLTNQKNALIIPYQAVLITNDKSYVFVIKNNTAYKKEVSLGQRLDENVIVLSGIEENDTVVIKGQINLAPGSKTFEGK